MDSKWSNSREEAAAGSEGGVPLPTAIEAFVRSHHAKFDASHDFAHVDRVRRMALRLARAEMSETRKIDLEVVELAALLHDVVDHKYTSEGDSNHVSIEGILVSNGFAVDRAERVALIVAAVSFRKEISNSSSTPLSGLSSVSLSGGFSSADSELGIELACVQDADRLDAIGAIGIARCFAFGATRGSAFHDPSISPQTAEDYAHRHPTKGGKGTCINHFYEKLFHIKDRLKTPAARRIAEKRHDFMKMYIAQFLDEWDAADGAATDPFQGCGMHIESALAGVPKDQRCSCPRDEGGCIVS